MSKVIVGRGLLAKPAWAARLGRDVALVTDKTVYKLYGRTLERALKRSGKRVLLHLLPANESAKKIGALLPLYGKLARARFGRDCAIAALGGGAVTDAAGFAAASYLRGVRWISIPTTLIGQVDSGFGGKTGVNLPEGKNLVGAFHQPELVVCDVDTLRTLPPRERLSGLGEILKYGLSLDAAFWRRLHKDAPKLVDGDPAATAAVVKRSAALKLSVVRLDPLETNGRRVMLNFGHTFGHAFESASGYALRHGEAVIHGMRAALRLSVKHAGLSMREANEADEMLSGLPIPEPPRAAAAKLIALMLRDKKAKGGKMRFVLLPRIGRSVLKAGVPEKDVVAALEAL